MKNKIRQRAFTLIEMLIVIVIIGILAAALIPRLSNARGRANDTARKAILSQVAASLVSYQIDKWKFPDGCGPLWTQTGLLLAWLDDIPKDPAWSTVVEKWISNEDGSNNIEWEYWYCAIKKNNQDNWGFVLMAVAETEWWANYVICSGDSISSSDDFIDIQKKKCKNFTEWDSLCSPWNNWDWECEYEAWAWQLRYIYIQ